MLNGHDRNTDVHHMRTRKDQEGSHDCKASLLGMCRDSVALLGEVKANRYSILIVLQCAVSKPSVV